jgi:hypothetical protein
MESQTICLKFETRHGPPTMTKASSNKHLLAELKNIAEGLGKTFAPFCEVVVHDLTHPEERHPGD